MHAKFWLESLKGRDHSEDVDIYRRIILKWNLQKWGSEVWIRFSWLRIGIGGGQL
jgi:hypothetical protein